MEVSRSLFKKNNNGGQVVPSMLHEDNLATQMISLLIFSWQSLKNFAILLVVISEFTSISHRQALNPQELTNPEFPLERT